MTVTPDTSLEEVRLWLLEHRGAGADCPACEQFAKEYDRSINRSMAYGLILLYRHYRDSEEFVHLHNFFTEQGAVKSNEGALLRHWGLIEEKVGEREDGNPRTGYYRLTEHGRRFARGEVRVPKYARLYSEKLLGFPGDETISIREALGRKFNYDELMGGTGLELLCGGAGAAADEAASNRERPALDRAA